MTTLEVLKAARELISKPENWTTVFLARDANGNPVPPCSSEATCFCAIGAIENAAGGGPEAAAHCELRSEMQYGSIAAFNDSQGHAAVIAAFDRAIARLSEESSS